jgi:erythromycin esterase-like protein
VQFRKLAAFAAALLLGLPSTAGAQTAGHGISRIDLGKPYAAHDYRFFAEAVGEAKVVGLGESIHLTREMPLVRLSLLRQLHEQKGFGVLALEGSLIDAWTAQERAYRSRSSPADRARDFSRGALFGLWQTDEMEQVIAYALSTQGGPSPLYLTSFDIQPGTARAYGGSAESSLQAFLSTLRLADPSAAEPRLRTWARALGPALACKAASGDPHIVAEIEAWITGPVSTALAARRPAIHLNALRLVPTMLRSRLEHCRAFLAAGKSMRVYQEKRDVLNAQLVVALLHSSPKMVLWAHHSHLHHNSLGKAPRSMGQHLKGLLGDELYTVGLFAAGGAATDSLLADRAKGLGIVFALAPRPLPLDQRFGVEKRLAGLSEKDFFLDLRDSPASLARPDHSRLEASGQLATALSQDYDAAILLHRVSGAELNFLPRPFRFGIRTAGRVLAHPILAAGLVLVFLAAIASGIRSLLRRRKARRGARPPKGGGRSPWQRGR